MRSVSKIARLLAAFATMTVLLACGGTAQAEKRVALVIGNNAYSTLPQLQKALGDAEVVGDTLAGLGFDVIRGRNLSRQGMIDKLAELTAKLSPGDIAAFFYAGHGVAIDNVNYLVPTDVPAATSGVRVRGASIAEGDVVAEIQAKGVRVALIVLDACRNNPFPKAAGRSIGSTRGLADAKPARGVFTIYSAGIGQEALDRLEPNDTNRNSVFTRIFAAYLAKPDVDLSALAVEVRERVYQLALKAKNEAGMPEPHEQTPAYYDQTIGGRVYLAGRTADPRPRPDQDPSPPSSATPSKPAPTGWLTSWLTGMGIGVAPKPEPAPRVTRLDLVLVANDPAMASGPPLHDYGNAKITYKIERSITFPGDIEGFSAIRDAMQNPAVEIVIAPSALKRINRNTDLVGRQIALVLDGRTVLSAAVLREPLGRRMQLTGNFSLDDISRLVNAISLNPSIGPAAARVESIAPAVHPARPAQTKPASRRIVVNFDALNAFGKAAGVGDKQLADYLAGFGIKLVASTAQRIAAFDERNIYEGKAVKATSGRSVLMQQGGRPVSYTLEFSEPVKSINFNRVALIAGPSGIVHPTWKATALDKAGHTVATAGEDVVRSYANVPAKTFTLSGAGIVRLVVTGDHRGFAAFSSLVLDNLFLVTE